MPSANKESFISLLTQRASRLHVRQHAGSGEVTLAHSGASCGHDKRLQRGLTGMESCV